jgi:hypothetical protein
MGGKSFKEERVTCVLTRKEKMSEEKRKRKKTTNGPELDTMFKPPLMIDKVGTLFSSSLNLPHGSGI